MSWDIYLTDPVNGETLELDTPHQMRGGTYAAEGTSEAWINVTYNYSDWYRRPGVFPGGKGICSIYGLSGADSIPVLEHAINALSAMEEPMSEAEIEEKSRERGGLYWVETRDNAIRPLYQLMALAKLRPDGIWKGD